MKTNNPKTIQWSKVYTAPEDHDLVNSEGEPLELVERKEAELKLSFAITELKEIRDRLLNAEERQSKIDKTHKEIMKLLPAEIKY